MLSNKKPFRDSFRRTGPTDVILLLDMSGSMSSRRDETIREVNRYLDKLRSDGLSYRVTVITFNEGTNSLIYSKNIQDVGELEHAEYHPGGWTRLLDAVGETLSNGWYPTDSRTLFVVITDGEENDSRHYSLQQVRSLIDSHRFGDYYGDFQFVFLGSGPDSWRTGQRLGFNYSVATNWNDPRNSENIYKSLYNVSSSYATGQPIGASMLNTSSTTATETAPQVKKDDQS